ncbi:MAG: tryptophan 7-halogenase [Planctomycetales bacterium]|nr:tryptophan 7-halogenase [Planctomycetales bacterium]
MPATNHFDFAVVGGGFAGSLTAAILAAAGRRVALFERLTHPRFAVGESSTPTAGLLVRDLAEQYGLPWLAHLAKYGDWKQNLPDVRCGLKRGFAYFDHRAQAPPPDCGDPASQLLVSANPDAARGDLHWHRADVDHWLFQKAAQLVALAQDGVSVTATRCGEGWSLKLACADKTAAGDSPANQRTRRESADDEVTASFLIDATGGANVSGEAQPQARWWKTQTAACFTHLRHVGAWNDALPAPVRAAHPFPCDASAQHHLVDGGWVWLLRFDDSTTSVGRVDGLLHQRSTNHHASPVCSLQDWRRRLQPYAKLASLFDHAEEVDEIGWRRSPRLQRLLVPAAGADWAMLPAAAGQVDPLHSTGIAHSLCGIEPLVEALLGPASQRTARLQAYSTRLEIELEWIDEIVGAAYQCMGDFRHFAAATMLYFAAATSYELARVAGRRPWFLCADDQKLRESVARWRESVGQAPPIEQLEAELREWLRPWNHVGLCDAQAQNLYRYETT